MSDHSLISPSMLSRMFACPGSVLAGKDVADSSSPAAELGTRLHAHAEDMLLAGFTDASDLESEQYAMVESYCRYVKEHIDNNSVLYVEHTVSLNHYVSGMRGSVDALIVGVDTVHVIDLKTGQHPVSAEDNLQLQAYALGAVEEFGAFNKTVYVHIWQPNNVSRARLTYDGLMEFSLELSSKANLAMQQNAPRYPSEEACRYCKAAATCGALHSQQVELIGGDFDDLTAPEDLTDDQIRTVVLHKVRVEQWLKKVYTHAMHRAEHSDPVSGLKRVEGRASRKFTTSGKEALVSCLGENAYEKKLIGVTAADKLLGKKVVDALCERRGSATLVPVGDKRPALPSAVDGFEVIE
jgi:CRISPR/Cas system-associated exonuclease Cas4 (RecB family)